MNKEFWLKIAITIAVIFVTGKRVGTVGGYVIPELKKVYKLEGDHDVISRDVINSPSENFSSNSKDINSYRPDNAFDYNFQYVNFISQGLLNILNSSAKITYVKYTKWKNYVTNFHMLSIPTHLSLNDHNENIPITVVQKNITKHFVRMPIVEILNPLTLFQLLSTVAAIKNTIKITTDQDDRDKNLTMQNNYFNYSALNNSNSDVINNLSPVSELNKLYSKKPFIIVTENGSNISNSLPTRKYAFKRFLRHERNPCYSEYQNSSGVYYYYDVLRVFKYIHGYADWSDDPNSKNNDTNTPKPRRRITVSPNYNFYDQITKSSNPSSVSSIKSYDVHKYPKSYANIAKHSSIYNKYNIRSQYNAQKFMFSKIPEQKSKILPKITEGPSNNYNDRNTLKTDESINIGNVYANPDEEKYSEADSSTNFLRANAQEINPSRENNILNERNKIIKNIKNIFIHPKTSSSNNEPEYNKNSYRTTESVITVGNVYADPDVRE